MKNIMCIIGIAFAIFLAGCTDSNTATFISDTESMEPTIMAGDKFVGDLAYYDNGKIERGDIVVYSQAEKTHVKRVIALPGESIRFDEGMVMIDGKPMEADIVENDIFGPWEELSLADDEYYVIGDANEKSRDSRHFGPIQKEDIKGKVIKIIPQS